MSHSKTVYFTKYPLIHSQSASADSLEIVSDRIPTGGNGAVHVGMLNPPAVSFQRPHCPPQVTCLNTLLRYRTFDGSCNNPKVQRGHWGMAGQPMERLLPPAYEDGIWSPRLHGKDGSKLTESRTISRFLMDDIDRPHHKYNLLLMQFGQFLAHDLTQSATIRTGMMCAYQN